MEGRRNKKWIVRLGVFWLCLATAHASVELGIDVLASHDYSLLAGKRIGLITNQTGVDADGTKRRLLLKRHRNLVALYTPEHGLDGTEKAGHYVKSRRDPLTGLGVYMLSEMNREARPDLFRRSSASKLDISYKVCGGTFIRTRVSEGESPQRIIAAWQPNEQECRRGRARYLLY
jgi:uncharacterized protein YbbC (DUF1343 family)